MREVRRKDATKRDMRGSGIMIPLSRKTAIDSSIDF
jgi:hypothetical protein